MSLRDDLRSMEAHSKNGTLNSYLDGTGDPLTLEETLNLTDGTKPAPAGRSGLPKQGD